MSFPYATLGNQCESRTQCALTSNAKYILPLSRVYYKRFTPMMYYPGHDSMYTVGADKLFGPNSAPEQIKDYGVVLPARQNQVGCSGCGK